MNLSEHREDSENKELLSFNDIQKYKNNYFIFCKYIFFNNR